MNDQTTSYAVVEKYSLAQQIRVYTAIAFTVRKKLGLYQHIHKTLAV